MPSNVFTPEQIAQIKQIVREMFPEIIQATLDQVDRNLTIDVETPELIATMKQVGVPRSKTPPDPSA